MIGYGKPDDRTQPKSNYKTEIVGKYAVLLYVYGQRQDEKTQ